MLKLKKNCTVCIQIQKDPKLEKEIFNTTFYVRNNNRTLKDVHDRHRDYFSYDALRNHVKKHQFLSERQATERSLQNTKNKFVAVSREKTVEAKEVWDEVIQQGLDDIRTGKVVVKPEALLKAAKDKSDYDLKVKDQQMAMAEMMWHFASGENKESGNYDRRIIEGQTATDYDPTQGPSGHLDEGTDGPSSIHYPPTWDAFAPRSGEVPSGNDF